MGSSTEYAAGPGAPAASEDSGGDEPKAREVDSGFDELRRESAAMLRNLADKYDAESDDSRARSARLLAESEAAGALAVQLAEESVRIRTEADRLAAQPTWLAGASDASAAPKVDEAPSASSSSSSSPEAGTATDDVTSAESAATTESGATPPPGPGPARGFASGTTSSSSSTASTPPGATGSAGSPTSPSSESDDWAPRPFESWRNQASQVNPRLLEL
jgi:hypothetical protein